jgi:hypothetical protein
MVTPTEGEVRELKRRWAERLLAQPGVVGVGITRDARGYHVTVHLDERAARRGLLQSIEGHPLHFRISGTLEHQRAAG